MAGRRHGQPWPVTISCELNMCGTWLRRVPRAKFASRLGLAWENNSWGPSFQGIWLQSTAEEPFPAPHRAFGQPWDGALQFRGARRSQHPQHPGNRHVSFRSRAPLRAWSWMEAGGTSRESAVGRLMLQASCRASQTIFSEEDDLRHCKSRMRSRQTVA